MECYKGAIIGLMQRDFRGLDYSSYGASRSIYEFGIAPYHAQCPQPQVAKVLQLNPLYLLVVGRE